MWIRRLSSFLSPSRAVDVLRRRQLLNECTKFDEAVRHVEGSSVYVGFDPTADSLHIGNLVTIMAMLHFQRAGYQPLAVVGGATGIIGDPSGRATEREPLSLHTLEQNVSGIHATLEKIFRNANNLFWSSPSPIPTLKVVNNADWYSNMSIIKFMSDIGRQFRISSMLRKESVNQRMNTQEGISFTEFSYQIFQAYDFLHLHRNYNCCLQIGGGDQWGNITAGCEFVRKCTGTQVEGITVPLVTTSSGEKIGKSAGNAVWLSANKTSPYHLYQYFVRTTDQDVERFLNYFTFTSTDEISSIMESHSSAPEQFLAQKHLAEQVTRLVHGDDGLQHAMDATSALFGDRDALDQLSEKSLEQLFQGAPTSELSKDQYSQGMKVADFLTTVGAATSKGMARRLVDGGGVYINHARIVSSQEIVSHEQHALHGRLTVLRIGKKNYHLIKWI